MFGGLSLGIGGYLAVLAPDFRCRRGRPLSPPGRWCSRRCGRSAEPELIDRKARKPRHHRLRPLRGQIWRYPSAEVAFPMTISERELAPDGAGGGSGEESVGAPGPFADAARAGGPGRGRGPRRHHLHGRLSVVRLAGAAQGGGPDRRADGIVALTGGASRVVDAVELLASGHGRRLLITGVNRTTHSGELARLAPDYERLFIVLHRSRPCRPQYDRQCGGDAALELWTAASVRWSW